MTENYEVAPLGGGERVVGVRRHVGGSRSGGCGGVKTPPYGMNHKRDVAVSVGPGMPGPYRLLFPAAGVRGR